MEIKRFSEEEEILMWNFGVGTYCSAKQNLEKPVGGVEMIEKMLNEAKRIEMFANEKMTQENYQTTFDIHYSIQNKINETTI